jgi:excisionase family DNA binding protein
MKVLTRDGAADLLQVPRATIDYLVQTQQIPFSRVGKRGVRFVDDRLFQWLEERENIEFRQNRKQTECC